MIRRVDATAEDVKKALKEQHKALFGRVERFICLLFSNKKLRAYDRVFSLRHSLIHEFEENSDAAGTN